METRKDGPWVGLFVTPCQGTETLRTVGEIVGTSLQHHSLGPMLHILPVAPDAAPVELLPFQVQILITDPFAIAKYSDLVIPSGKAISRDNIGMVKGARFSGGQVSELQVFSLLALKERFSKVDQLTRIGPTVRNDSGPVIIRSRGGG